MSTSTKKPALEFLRILCDPGPSVTNLDIIAVHGLNLTDAESHAMNTWTASNGRMWLKDFLPSQLPKARIMLFGYNSQVAFNASTNGIEEHALNLLNRLNNKRRDDEDEPLKHPIIFICHSLGGIIVKRALTMAKLDTTYSPIRTSTYGIVFFATPHQGGKFQQLGSIAALIARCTLKKAPSWKLLEALKKDSLYADDIINDFRFELEDYYFLTFYETLPYKNEGLIVDQKPATLGLPGAREMQVPLDANHSDICRFEDIEDDDYEQVVDQKSATLGLPGTREIQVPLDANHFDICRFENIQDDDYEQVGGNIIGLARRAVKNAANIYK